MALSCHIRAGDLCPAKVLASLRLFGPISLYECRIRRNFTGTPGAWASRSRAELHRIGSIIANLCTFVISAFSLTLNPQEEAIAGEDTNGVPDIGTPR
jgi:hypothetical protein